MLLEEIIGKEVCAYRAGGYCLSDYSDFPKLFRDNHILLDSSVVPGKTIYDGSVSYERVYETLPSSLSF